MLNKINPIYILLFILTILIVSFSQLDVKKDQLDNKQSSFNEFKKDTKIYVDLKNRWDSKNNQNKIMEKILSSNRNIEKKDYRNKTILTLRSENRRDIEKFVNSVLNESFIVLKLDVKPKIAVFELGLVK